MLVFSVYEIDPVEHGNCLPRYSTPQVQTVTVLRDDVLQFALFEQGEQSHVGVGGLGSLQVAVGNLLSVVKQCPNTIGTSVIWSKRRSVIFLIALLLGAS